MLTNSQINEKEVYIQLLSDSIADYVQTAKGLGQLRNEHVEEYRKKLLYMRKTLRFTDDYEDIKCAKELFVDAQGEIAKMEVFKHV